MFLRICDENERLADFHPDFVHGIFMAQNLRTVILQTLLNVNVVDII